MKQPSSGPVFINPDEKYRKRLLEMKMEADQVWRKLVEDKVLDVNRLYAAMDRCNVVDAEIIEKFNVQQWKEICEKYL